MANPNRITRDKKVRVLFKKIDKKYPRWKPEYVFEEVAKEMCISVKTTEDIIKGYGIYAY